MTEPSTITSLADLGSAGLVVGVCALLSVSATAKLANPGAALRMVRGVGVRVGMAKPMTVCLIAAESVTAVVAVWPSAHVVAGVMVMALGTTFGGAAIITMLTHRVVLCACFGREQTPLGARHIARVPLFWAVGVLFVMVPPPWPDRQTTVVLAAITSALCLAYVLIALREVLRAGADRSALSESTGSSVLA